MTSFYHSITYTNKSYYFTHLWSMCYFFLPMPEGNQHFYHFTCKWCLADVRTALVMNSCGLGGHKLPEGEAGCGRTSPLLRLPFIFTPSLPPLPVLLSCLHQPTQCELAETNQELQKRRSLFHIHRHKKVHFCHSCFPFQLVGPKFKLKHPHTPTLSFPDFYLSLTPCQFFPKGFLVRRAEPKTSSHNLINMNALPF